MFIFRASGGSELGEIHLTLTFSGKQSVFEAQKAIQITGYTK